MKRGHKGNATATVLSSGMSPSDMTFTVSDATGYPDGTEGPFFIAVSKGQIIEEKVLCSSRSGTLFTIWTDGIDDGRGMDDTTAQDHPINAPVEHVWTAVEAEEMSAHVVETDGAHGYPDISNVATLTGAQTLEDKTLNNPTFTGTVTGAEPGYSPFLLMGA